MMSPRALKAKIQSRRDAILEAASELFGEHGVQTVTTRQIAQMVGISQPSIYAHFPSIQAIQDEVGARSFALLENAISASINAPPETQLRIAIQGYLEFGLQNPQAYRIAFMLEHSAPAKHEGHQDMNTFALTDHPGPRAFGHLVRIVALNRPDLSSEAVEIRSQCLWAMLHGLVALILARPHFPWADQTKLLAEQSSSAFNMVFN